MSTWLILGTCLASISFAAGLGLALEWAERKVKSWSKR